MKQPKKQAGSNRAKRAQKPEDDAPVVARVFSNYVLAPFTRHPEPGCADSALHGAAILVFDDKEQKKIALRTGFPVRIAKKIPSPKSSEDAAGGAEH